MKSELLTVYRLAVASATCSSDSPTSVSNGVDCEVLAVSSTAVTSNK